MQVLSPSVPEQKLQSLGVFVIALAAVIALLYFGRVFCITLVISVIIAFLLDPFVAFFMRMRIPRGVSSFLVCSIALLFVYLAGLGVYTQLSGFSDDLPAYSARVNTLVDSVAVRWETIERNAYQLLVPKRFHDKERVQLPPPPPPEPKRRRRVPDPPPETPPAVQEVRVLPERTSLVNYIYAYVTSFYQVLLMISFVPFLVYFMLSWRDHIRKTFLMMFEGRERIMVGRSWESIADMARAYVVGNFILGIILSVASSFCFWSWHLSYWELVGPLSGFLSLVPYIGLPLAMAPPLFAALTTYTTLTPYVIIGATVAFFHLLALNLLYPAVVGARVHLNPLAVTVALMFWGTIWGGIGLVLAIPVTAGIKAVLDNVDSLQPYGKMLGD